MRCEPCGRLVQVHPRRDTEALATSRPPVPDLERSLDVSLAIGGVGGCPGEEADRGIELIVGERREPRAEVGGFHHAGASPRGDEEPLTCERATELRND